MYRHAMDTNYVFGDDNIIRCLFCGEPVADLRTHDERRHESAFGEIELDDHDLDGFEFIG